MEENTQYAVIRAGGRQFRVSAGQKILVSGLPGEKGAAIAIGEVLMVGGGSDAPRVGAPLVAGATVNGTILGTHKAKKVVAFKRRRRKGYRRKIGHRQQMTELRIDEIKL